MLIVRGDKFVKKDGKYYIVGSSSNFFYDNNIHCMGSIELMAWIIDEEKYDVSQLEELQPREDLKLIVNSNNLSFSKKCKVIANAIKKSDTINVKLPLPNSIIGCHYAKKFRKPYVVESSAHSFSSLWYHGGIKYKLASVPVDLLMKYYHRFAPYIIYCSQTFLQKKYPSKGKQIGTPDVVMKKPDHQVLNRRIEHIENHQGEYVLGLIGATHAEYRGHDTLIRAAAILKNKGYNVKVNFLGGGTADDKRKNVAKKCNILESVEFCGRKPHEEVLTWIDNIDVLVMPTKVESLGRSIVEAMSRGCPVIGSRETAIGEQIGSECLTYADDYNEIANKVERIIKDKEYTKYCAYENFYRSHKYISEISNRERKKFFDEFYEENKLCKN